MTNATEAAELLPAHRVDDFQGDNAHLVECIDALLDMDDRGVLVPNGIGKGSHAYRMLCAARHRLAHPPASPTAEVVELVAALREARDALHFHYVEWDGEPEDAVPLQLARAKCDAALAKVQKP